MTRVLRAVDVHEGETVTKVGDQEVGPSMVIEHYRPFRAPDRVGLTLANGQVIHAHLNVLITVTPPDYSRKITS